MRFFASLGLLLVVASAALTSTACTESCHVGEYGDCDGDHAVEYCTGGDGQYHWYSTDCARGEHCVQGEHGSCVEN